MWRPGAPFICLRRILAESSVQALKAMDLKCATVARLNVQGVSLGVEEMPRDLIGSCEEFRYVVPLVVSVEYALRPSLGGHGLEVRDGSAAQRSRGVEEMLGDLIGSTALFICLRRILASPPSNP